MVNLCSVQRILLLVVVFVIVLEMADARGARYGGSRYSSARYSSTRYSRTSYRVRTSSRVRTGARVRVRYGGGARYNGIYIGGYRHYGHYDDDYYASQMTICENEREGDGNGTVLGRFVCPMYYQSSDYSYCCGPPRGQHCCRFMDDPKRGWGLAIGLCVGMAVVSLLIVLCMRSGCSSCETGGGGGSIPSFYDSD